jgi:ubiquinone biosynthesis protein
VRELHLKRVSPRRLPRQWSEVGTDALALARELPLEIRRVLAQLKSGRLKVTFHHDGLEPLENTLERVSNRLAFALVLSALVAASSIIIHARVPPQWHGVPVIGLAGYVLVGVMGVWLLFSILRHGKM